MKCKYLLGICYESMYSKLWASMFIKAAPRGFLVKKVLKAVHCSQP